MKKSLILSILLFLFSILFINNAYAVTITESTDPTDGLTTIEDNSIVIGITRFEDGVVITAQRAATAGVNDALFNINFEDYSGVNIYYYLGGDWFVLDEENQANPLDETVADEKKVIEELQNPEIYYVNNVEKKLTIEYSFDLTGGLELEFNTDNNKDSLIEYNDGSLLVPATVKTLEIKIINPITDDVAAIIVLTKDEEDNTDYEETSSTIPVLGVSLNKTILTMKHYDVSASLVATVTPSNATNKNITWSSSNVGVATVLGGVITPLSIGTTTITVTTEDGDFTVTCLVTVEGSDLTNYNSVINSVQETDYTEDSWTTYQNVVAANVVTVENTQDEVDTVTGLIILAQKSLITKLYQAQTEAIINLENYLIDNFNQKDYVSENWNEVLNYYNTGLSNINSALTTIIVGVHLSDAKLGMDGIFTIAETLEDDKTYYSNILTTIYEGYIPANYTTNWTELVNIYDKGISDINSATTSEMVASIHNNTIDQMALIKTDAQLLAEAKADAIAAIGVNYLVGTPRILTQTEISAIDITVGANQKLFEVMITPDYANLETAQLSGRAVNTVFTVATPNITVYYPHWNGTTNVLESGDSTGSGGPYIVGMAAYRLSYSNLENPAPFYVLVNDTIDADVSITIKLEDSEWNDVLYANQTVIKDYNDLLLMIAKYEAKEELTTALGTYEDTNYTEGNWTILNGYKTTGDTAIENATTVGEVSTAKTTALEAMDGVLTNAEIEANAILYAQNNSTLTGDLIAGITATFPVIVPSYFEAGLYKINSEILLNGDVDGVITITKNGTPLVITGGLAAGTYTFTQLARTANGLSEEPTPAAFIPSTYNAHVENYTVSVSSNLVPINTTISIRSIISKDNFVTNIELSKLENLELNVLADLPPELISVGPEEGDIILQNNEPFILKVKASDSDLYELEIDHNMELSLPEFSVYASEATPYGTEIDLEMFNSAGVSINYSELNQEWTINFGTNITNAFITNGGITFYLVLKDSMANSWGSMSPTTSENTFTYNVSVAYNETVTGVITHDDYGIVSTDINFLNTNDLHMELQVIPIIEGESYSFSGTLSGSINGTISGEGRTMGVDQLAGIINLTAGNSEPIRIIGNFIQSGIHGDFVGEIITGPLSIPTESMEINSVGSINTIEVGQTLQLNVNILPIEASSNVIWSVYVSNSSIGSIDQNGLFTALSEGSATIIVVSNDGSFMYDNFIINVIPKS